MLLQDQINCKDLDGEWLDFLKAVSVDTIHLETREAADTQGDEFSISAGAISPEPFERAREQIESRGMKLNNVFYSCPSEIPLGLEGADDRIEAWIRLLEALGKAGVPALGWNYKPMGNFRTPSTRGRGGVEYSTFDYGQFIVDRPDPYEPGVSEEEMFGRLERFLTAVIPVAEKCGVSMALHPDDPPVPEPLAGVAQICSSVEQFRRIFAIAPSEHHRMLFCQGCMTELLGEGVYDFIAEMAATEMIQWVHFRNVRGQLPRFQEVFLDEGDIDMRRAMEIYRDNGFAGPFMMDHSPTFLTDPSTRNGKAFANG